MNAPLPIVDISPSGGELAHFALGRGYNGEDISYPAATVWQPHGRLMRQSRYNGEDISYPAATTQYKQIIYARCYNGEDISYPAATLAGLHRSSSAVLLQW